MIEINLVSHFQLKCGNFHRDSPFVSDKIIPRSIHHHINHLTLLWTVLLVTVHLGMQHRQADTSIALY